MASRGVSVLKFVGTVSLGLLTGLSYSLSTLTVPTLLTLPSASSASTAFKSIAASATTHLRALAGVSSTVFALAFLLSPRAVRHPYLLYTSVFVLISRLGASDRVAPYLYLPASAKPSSSTTAFSKPSKPQPSSGSRASTLKSQRSSNVRGMEMSYDVIGGSDGTSDAATDSASDKDVAEDEALSSASVAGSAAAVNGEEVRDAVEVFLKKQLFSTAAAGLAFAMAVVGIWGDAVVQSPFGVETVVVG